jgi:hypothetical protein
MASGKDHLRQTSVEGPPTPRARAIAWSMLAVSLLLGALATFVWLKNAARGPGVLSPQIFLVPGYSALGTIIVFKRSHMIGWLFLSFSLVAAITAFCFEYSVAAYATFVGDVPKLPWLAWLQQELWPFNFVFLGLLLLLFPTGRTTSPLFHKILVALVGLWTCTNLIGLLDPNPTELLGGHQLLYVANPIPFKLVPGFEVHYGGYVFFAAIAALLASAAAPIARWRRGKSEERQQMRWLAYIAVLSIAGAVASGLLGSISHTASSVAGALPITGAVLGIPIAVGIALLRYRLYDIDRVVSRTLVYGSLTIILAGTYVLVVFALRGLLSSFTGSSNVAVAASTLGVAALFRPLRGRVQSFIDRRFNRSRFDAAETLESFVIRLREEVDLDSMSRQLETVVMQTMQPAHVSLWLRDR